MKSATLSVFSVLSVVSLLLSACTEKSNTESTPLQQEGKQDQTSSEVIPKKDTLNRDTIDVERPKRPTQKATYSGRWFQIEYPTNFTPSPTGPTAIFGDYQYIETDEATFTSPDGTVEFFIFSPQWSGDPKDYLNQKSNEKIVDEMKQATSDIPVSIEHHWVTFEDKEGKYMRSFHSIRSETESTHYVFGVKYTNRKMYERYKAAYVAFQQSLQQFAD